MVKFGVLFEMRAKYLDELRIQRVETAQSRHNTVIYVLAPRS
jgi:hypothetical protein